MLRPVTYSKQTESVPSIDSIPHSVIINRHRERPFDALLIKTFCLSGQPPSATSKFVTAISALRLNVTFKPRICRWQCADGAAQWPGDTRCGDDWIAPLLNAVAIPMLGAVLAYHLTSACPRNQILLPMNHPRHLRTGELRVLLHLQALRRTINDQPLSPTPYRAEPMRV